MVRWRSRSRIRRSSSLRAVARGSIVGETCVLRLGSRRSMDNRGIDPIEFELVRNALISIVDDMALTIVRTAYSNVVRDNMDFSTALCDRSGNLIAQGLTIPLHLGSVPDAMSALLHEFGDDIASGDVWIMNDPFSGGMHLPDVFVIKPILTAAGELCGFAVTIAHHTDVGGRVAGGNASD